MRDQNTTDKSIQSMRAGWTVIELIFVIILIAILGSIAMEKLSTTRDDAKLSADVANMNVCLRDMKNIYTATHTKLEDINVTSCNVVVCYTIDISPTTVNVTLNSSGANYCSDIQNVGGHLARKYKLSGTIIKR